MMGSRGMIATQRCLQPRVAAHLPRRRGPWEASNRDFLGLALLLPTAFGRHRPSKCSGVFRNWKISCRDWPIGCF